MRRAALLLSLGCLGPLVLAHDDDPKFRQRFTLAPLPAGVGQPGTGNAGAFDAQGVQLLSWMTPGDLGTGLGCNDVWGYVSPSGREYAVQCTEESTIFVEVTDPMNPSLVGTIPGPVGVWRDAKVYGEYAYSVHETDGIGVQVIDLSQIDQGSVSHVNTFEGTDSGYTHNVAINESSGYLYRCGGSGHGLRIYDLNADPVDPPHVATWDGRYSHDVQVVTWSDGRELAFSCGGFNGGWDDTGLTIVDVSTKQSISVVKQLYHTGGQYSHQGWLSEDRQYFYLGDELDEYYLGHESRTHVYWVGDPDNAFYVGYFENDSKAINHNLYTHDGRIYAANYRSGLRIFDTDVDPVAPPEVAWFDTHPTNDDADFGGAWSVYPYLPSGVVLLSDRELGLFVLRVDEELGRRLCDPAATNSTGEPGVLSAFGSPVLDEDNLALEGRQLPVGEWAVLMISPEVGGAIGLGGAPAGVCVGVPWAFHHAGASTVDGAGVAPLPLDLGAVPLFGGGTAAVQPGDSWVFQVLYGDGGARRLTDALELIFE